MRRTDDWRLLLDTWPDARRQLERLDKGEGFDCGADRLETFVRRLAPHLSTGATALRRLSGRRLAILDAIAARLLASYAIVESLAPAAWFDDLVSHASELLGEAARRWGPWPAGTSGCQAGLTWPVASRLRAGASRARRTGA